MVKFKKKSIFLAITFFFKGCAISSGLQTYDLPDAGEYKTNEGAELNVIQINQTTLPTIVEESSQPLSNRNFFIEAWN